MRIKEAASLFKHNKDMNKKAIPTLTRNLHLLLLGAALPWFLGGCGKAPEGGAQAQATPAPFTGTVHEVKMRGTAKGYFYEPAQLSIKLGDKVRFLMVDGGPHNVNFTGQKIPGGANVILEKEGKLLGALLQAPGQATEIEFAKPLPVGDYHYVCDPHVALGMKGKITVSF